MSVATQTPSLTKEQEDYVWSIICIRMNDEDRNPIEVIEENYRGNRSHYLQVMAGHLGIKFCSYCGKPTEKCQNLACLDQYQL